MRGWRDRRWRAALVAGTVLVGALAACGGTDNGEASGGVPPTSEGSTSTETTADGQSGVLRILVTNDDGIDSPGLDQLVVALAALPDVEVTVVAPAENQSGTSDRTTDGPVSSSSAATASGVAGTAVAGFPADSVVVALGEQGLDPDVVVSGVNEGQNVGPVAALSGTVGAARAAARLGVPAVAASAGIAYDEAQVGVAVELVVAWITANRPALVARQFPAEVVSFNVPSCAPATMGQLVEVPIGTVIPEGANIFASTCTPGALPADDVMAMVDGFPSQTRVPLDLVAPGG